MTAKKEPDADPVFVLTDEAAGAPFDFEWRDERFSIPHVRDLDLFTSRIVIKEAVSEDDMILALFKQGMGDADFDRLEKVGMSRHAFGRLVDAWRKHCGLDAGESSASSD